jgi:hypothetical protein
MKNKFFLSIFWAASALVASGLQGCCPPRMATNVPTAQATQAAAATPSASSATTSTSSDLANPPKPSWAVDFDMGQDRSDSWNSEWTQIKEISIETKGQNKVLQVKWNTSKGFDLTRTLGPPQDISNHKTVSFHVFAPKSIADAKYSIKVWLDDQWPQGAQLYFDSADGDHWKEVKIDVSTLSNVDFSSVKKLGIYMEPEQGGEGREGEVTIYIDNVGMD